MSKLKLYPHPPGELDQASEQQIRYNANKPKLSYLFANEKSVLECMAVNSYLVPRLYTVTQYLNGGRRGLLAEAAMSCLAALQFGLTGKSTASTCFWELIEECPEALVEICKVYEFGEKKYEAWNFRKGAPITQYLDSALRHELGPERDEESGCHTLAHAFWNYWQALNQPDNRDNRPPRVET